MTTKEDFAPGFTEELVEQLENALDDMRSTGENELLDTAGADVMNAIGSVKAWWKGVPD